MLSKISLAFTLALLTSAAGFADGPDNPFGIEWDRQAASQMSREDRLAYQRRYKAAVEEAARKAGGLEPRAPRAAAQTRQAPAVPFTSITYHSGALSPATAFSLTVGNRFDTAQTTQGALAPAEMSGSISLVEVHMANVGGTGAFLSFYDQLSGTSANFLSSVAVPLGPGSNGVPLPTSILYVGSSFLAGVWNFQDDAVNLATGTVAGQGFHGMEINDINGTGFRAYTMTNAAFSVSGNVARPVELLSFTIE
ncbi:MAG: hypothetical protein AAF725_08245 [Acidobacteriota bacterium]